MRRAVRLLPLLALLVALEAGQREPDPPRDAPADVFATLRKLPARDEGRFGREGDPMNLVFFGDEAAVSRALESAGWTRVPRSITGSALEGLEDLWLGRTLARFPPLNEYRYLGRVQDMNWAQVVVPIATRHHFRLWRTGIVDPRGREVWMGTANYDLKVRWLDLSHTPDPDADAERDYIAGSLKGRAALDWVALPQIPREGRNDKGYPFRTDGRVLVVGL